MTFWNCLDDIVTHKTGILHKEPEFKKVWSSFMILRYLSMDKRFMDIAAEMNKYQDVLTSEQMYLFLVKFIPKHGKVYFKYIKPDK